MQIAGNKQSIRLHADASKRRSIAGLHRRPAGASGRRAVILRVAPEPASDNTSTTHVTDTQPTTEAQVSTNGNGSTNGNSPQQPASLTLPDLELKYAEPTGMDLFWTRAKLVFALPWRRFAKNSVLTIKLDGDLSDQNKSWLESGVSIPQVCNALQKGALDPRVAGLAIEIGPLNVGYAKLQELRRHLEYFKASGKFTIAYIKQGGEKEYYLASACNEIYTPETGNLFLRGFVVGGSFLRGVLDKVGVEPQVQRIGAYKSAGDQFMRRDMAPAQREQLQAILEDTYSHFVSTIAAARNKTEEEVKQLIDAGLYEAEDLFKAGWIDGMKYEDELIKEIKVKLGVPEDKMDKPLKKVGVRKLSSVNPGTYPALQGGKKRIVVLRTSGAIVGKSSGAGGTITPDSLIPKLRALAQDKSVAGVVLRVDSPGGDALASDLMWREVCKLGEKKPVVASMGDVAASGGYYISMAAGKIVAEPLTITGSIGVVTAKFNLAELYNKVGFSKELISKGRYAELLADNRPFNEDENQLFERSALAAYESFRNKAAGSRKMAVEAMQEVAQGRVWTGQAALQRGLVDALGGVHAAVQLVKEAAGIKADEKVTVVDLGTSRPSPLAVLRGAVVAAMLPAALASPQSLPSLLGALTAPLLASSSNVASTLPMAIGQPAVSLGADAVLMGIRSALGSEAAAAVSTAQSVMQSGSGVAMCVEPELLAIQAVGSVAAAGGAKVASSLQSQPSLSSLQEDETFLYEP